REGRSRRSPPRRRRGRVELGPDRRRPHRSGNRATSPQGGLGDHPFQERRPGGAGPGDRPASRRGGGNSRGLMSKNVVIIGGVLVGLSSALFLTEAGAEVTIIDNSALGSGAARGNAGFMCTAIV